MDLKKGQKCDNLILLEREPNTFNSWKCRCIMCNKIVILSEKMIKKGKCRYCDNG